MEVYLGKTVIYEPAGGMQYRGMKLVAIITRVHENDRVNLAIFDPTGNVMQNPPTNISIDKLSEAAPESIYKTLTPPLYATGEPNAHVGVHQQEGVPNIPFDKSELPAGARMVEHRPATPEEIEAAKAGIGVPKVKSPKKPVKKPVRKPKSPRKPKSGY